MNKSSQLKSNNAPIGNFNKVLGYILYSWSFLSIVIMIIACCNDSVWIDETFSLSLISKPYGEMLSIAVTDVHPPLYYIILRSIVDAVKLIYPGVDIIILGKLVSVIPFIILVMVSIFKLRRQFGLLFSAIFSFCITSMPSMMQYSVEIRMYSFGLLFVTLCLIMAYDITVKPSLLNWTLFTVFGLAAAYHHYFSLVSAGLIYAYLLIYFIFKNRKEIFKWAICAAATIVGYLPWLFIALNQISAVKDDYWISPVRIGHIPRYIAFPIEPSDSNILILCIYCIALLAAIIFTVWYSAKRLKDSPEKNCFAIVGFMVIMGTAAVGVAASLIIRPVFIARYLVPSLGCFWLWFAYFADKISTSYKKLFVLLMVGIMLLGGVETVEFIKTEVKAAQNINYYLENTDMIEAGDIIIHDAQETQRINAYFNKDTVNYTYNVEVRQLSRSVYGNVDTITEVDCIKDFLNQGKTVWLTLLPGNDELPELFRQNGLALESIDSFNTGRNQFEFYLITKDQEGIR